MIEEFFEIQEELIKLVEPLQGLNLKEIFMYSPATKLTIYSLQDALTIILNHEKRHISQMHDCLQRDDSRASG